MDQLAAIRTFLAVADRASFAAAARSLRLSAAGVTRAVARLERELGIALFARTTRSVQLTGSGAIYAERCRRILVDLEDARASVRGDDARPRGNLSVTAPVLFGRLHVLPIAEALSERHSGLAIRLTFVDRVTHLVEEGFDAAIRIGALGDSALLRQPLTAVRRVTVASPTYLAAAGEPDHPRALRQHRTIVFEGIGTTNEWRFGARGEIGVTVHPRLLTNDAASAIAAAISGHGITRALSYQVFDALAAETLRRILPAFEPPPIPVSLLTQANRRGSPNIAALIEQSRAYFSERRFD